MKFPFTGHSAVESWLLHSIWTGEYECALPFGAIDICSLTFLCFPGLDTHSQDSQDSHPRFWPDQSQSKIRVCARSLWYPFHWHWGNQGRHFIVLL